DFEPMAEENAVTSQTIGRQELSKRIAKESQLSQKQAAEVLEATLTAIREALQNGEEVRLVGFGSFKVRQSAARKGVNPRNREPIQRSEEHTSELQSLRHLVCRLLLEKKKKINTSLINTHISIQMH